MTGFITGPDDRPGCGLGRGGERLRYRVMGGAWSYDGGHNFAMHGPDKDFYDELVAGIVVGIVGRGMYDAAGLGEGPTRSPARFSCSAVQDPDCDRGLESRSLRRTFVLSAAH
ncbi:hypothetical protein [Arthrobacter sp. ISL-72]|uniref:hypothetical protein n=1 Tax=Arthrobacter sp. ISL-72 TaxID=2819114 RepID=UPI001BE85999|nr:hypothetical protein [Arthrobacter sp. ISL-72]MBT2597892.1 hypothetical protein [Arthrobacter sp. ISL-72]